MNVTQRAVGLLWCCAVAAIHAQGSPAAPSPTAVPNLIVGTVVDAGSGAPVADAIVGITTAPFLARLRNPDHLVETDAQGRFLLRDLPAGQFTIQATATGYLPGAAGATRPEGPSQDVTLAPDTHIGDIVIRLFKYATATGTVTDEAGEPVVGASVKAYRSTFVGGQRRLHAPFSGTTDDRGVDAETDDRGVYRLTWLVPGDYVFAIVSAPSTVPVAAVSDYSQALANGAGDAYSEALETSRSPHPTSPATVVGDLRMRSGSGALPPLPAADGHVMVYPTTFYPSAMTVAAASVVPLGSGEQKANIDFQLAPVSAVRVSGTVTGPDGPQGNIGVRLVPADVEGFSVEDVIPVPSALTTSTGAFTFLGITPGSYTLKVTKTARAITTPSAVVMETEGGALMVSPETSTADPSSVALTGVTPVQVGDTDIKDVGIILRTGARIVGHLAFDGAAARPGAKELSRVAIRLEPESGALYYGPIDNMFIFRPDATGKLESAQFPRGRYFIRPMFGMPPPWTVKSAMVGGRDAYDTAIELGGADINVVVTFTDRPSRMTGSVRDAGRQIDADTSVVLFPTDDRTWSAYGVQPRLVQVARTGRDGRYALSGMPPGDYFVTALKESDMRAWPDPAFLARIATLAQRLTIRADRATSLDLTTVVIR